MWPPQCARLLATLEKKLENLHPAVCTYTYAPDKAKGYRSLFHSTQLITLLGSRSQMADSFKSSV